MSRKRSIHRCLPEVIEENKQAASENREEMAHIDLVSAAIERVSDQSTSLLIAEGEHAKKQRDREDRRRSLNKADATLAASTETLAAVRDGCTQVRLQLKERLIAMCSQKTFTESPGIQEEFQQYLKVLECGSVEEIMRILHTIRISMATYVFLLHGGEVVPEREILPREHRVTESESRLRELLLAETDVPREPRVKPPPREQREQCSRLHIRWMIRRDIPEVLRIETLSQEHPWCEEDFLKCLRQRNCIGMVAESGEDVCGFMIYELFRKKLSILNFAVHPKHRFQGIGAQMAEKLVSKLSSHQRIVVEIPVRETNLDAQAFLRAVSVGYNDWGFRAVELIENAYLETDESAIVFAYNLNEPAPWRSGRQAAQSRGRQKATEEEHRGNAADAEGDGESETAA